MPIQDAPFRAVPDQFDLLAQVESPTPLLSGRQSGSQVAVSEKVREEMVMLANIMIDVFLEQCVPISDDVPMGSVTVRCPICMERRSYIVSTEVFFGQPSWEVMRVLHGRR
jgi:hypothetical protein